MNKEFFEAIEMFEQERGIPQDYMLDKVEAALLSAAKKAFGTSDNAVVIIDRNKKDIKLCQQKTVLADTDEMEDANTQIFLSDAVANVTKRAKVGELINIPVKTKEFGRIAAQTAKQVIIQGIRDAERGLLYQELNAKLYEILSATVTRIEPNGNVLLSIGKNEAMLVKNEQIPGEKLKEGDHIKIYVSEVRETKRGPQVIISRTHSGLVKRLFELEVPEIFDGIVEIKAIAREAGSRTKIAVYSSDESVDAVGACIGTKGQRIAHICDELKGEKVDIIRFSEDVETFVAQALAPADIISVAADPDSRICTVVVSDDQLSLAIGKEGQNARLAAKLTGHKIDIKPLSGIGA